MLLIGVEFYLSVWPLGEKSSVRNFFANYVSVVAVVVIWIAAQVWYRCPVWVDARDIDLDEWRRFYGERVEDEDEGIPVRRSLGRKLKVLFE